jgi:hypothetical protein
VESRSKNIVMMMTGPSAKETQCGGSQWQAGGGGGTRGEEDPGMLHICMEIT